MPPRLARRLAYGVLVVSVLITAHLSGVRLGPLLDSKGRQDAWALFGGFANPDLSGEFLRRIANLSLESVLIGVLATSLAMVLGLLLALIAIRIPELDDAPGRALLRRTVGGAIRFLVRGLLAIFRSIPDIVWAFLFVRMIGLGPGPAVLAITVSTAGIFGKLFSELAEAVEPESIRALRRMGLSRFGILLYGVLPQVWRQWALYSFFRLECSVRSASILGIVGAGGLGSEIALSIRYFEYDKLATTLLAVLVFVVAIEILSAFLRRRAFKWTLAFIVLGSAFALMRLDIPWHELTADNLLPKWLYRGASTDRGAFLTRSLIAAAETVGMAWCATWAAALIAVILSPFATRTLSLSGYRSGAVKGRFGLSTIGGWLVFAVSRLTLQISRAIPELTLALVFVVWVGPGSFAGVLAICVHTIGVLGRLYTDVYDEVDPGTVGALQNIAASRLGVWIFGIFPQASARLLAFTLYRFEVNVRATAMVGFVGAGGIGDSIDTAISLFHGQDLVMLLFILFGLVVTLDFFGDRARNRILTSRFRSTTGTPKEPPHGASKALPAGHNRRRAKRFPRAIGVLFRPRGTIEFAHATVRTISAVGMFIETASPATAESIIEIALPMKNSPPERPDPDPSTIGLGRVVYVRVGEVPGMGIEFLEPIPPVFRHPRHTGDIPVLKD